MKSAAAIDADDIKNAGGGKSKGKNAGIVDAVETGGKHEKEKGGEIPTGGTDEVPNEIAAEGGGGLAICEISCHAVPFWCRGEIARA